jgi:hypothetical protein
MSHQGSCHCGRIAFTVDGEPESGLECNCSICQRRGHVLWFVPRSALVLKTPEADLATYTFNKHSIRHQFCAVCGCGVFGLAAMPDGTPMAAINLRCLTDIDLASVPRQFFDGKSL